MNELETHPRNRFQSVVKFPQRMAGDRRVRFASEFEKKTKTFCFQEEKLQLASDLQKSEQLKKQEKEISADIERLKSGMEESERKLVPLERFGSVFLFEALCLRHFLCWRRCSPSLIDTWRVAMTAVHFLLLPFP